MPMKPSPRAAAIRKQVQANIAQGRSAARNPANAAAIRKQAEARIAAIRKQANAQIAAAVKRAGTTSRTSSSSNVVRNVSVKRTNTGGIVKRGR